MNIIKIENIKKILIIGLAASFVSHVYFIYSIIFTEQANFHINPSLSLVGFLIGLVHIIVIGLIMIIYGLQRGFLSTIFITVISVIIYYLTMIISAYISEPEAAAWIIVGGYTYAIAFGISTGIIFWLIFLLIKKFKVIKINIVLNILICIVFGLWLIEMPIIYNVNKRMALKELQYTYSNYLDKILEYLGPFKNKVLLEALKNESKNVRLNAASILNLTIPKLISPKKGMVLDNGRTDRLDEIVWNFDWSDCFEADKYQIYVYHIESEHPIIDTQTSTSSYQHVSSGSYIVDRNRYNWAWRVRPYWEEMGGWGKWSDVVTFDVEPVNTDSPVPK